MGVLDRMPNPILRRGENVRLRVGKRKGVEGKVEMVPRDAKQWLIHDVWVRFADDRGPRPFKCYNLERVK